jgi:hypothetical protein
MIVIVGAYAIKHHDPNTDLCENRRCNPPHLRSFDNLEVGHGRKRIGSTGPPNSLGDLGSCDFDSKFKAVSESVSLIMNLIQCEIGMRFLL